MEKINYQLITDKIIEERCKTKRERLLLHACCAPCATYVLEYLTKNFDITVFFSNSNITDKSEYKKRLRELYRFCKTASFCKGVEIIEDEYNTEEYYKFVKGLESEPEGGKRCDLCFKMRISRTAEFAAKNGFPIYATTLTVSPHKNAALINKIGESCAEKNGVLYLPSDFKKRGGYQRSIVLCREYDIYRQKYCGCIFSDNSNRAAE